MAIRLRRVEGYWVALCAVESDAKEGDVYLDDAQHYALACKFASEYNIWEDAKMNRLANTQKVRDAKEEIEKWLQQEAGLG